MIRLDLNGDWQLRRTDQSEWMPAVVPGSVAHDLLQAGEIVDPFYRVNEWKVLPIFDYDYEYRRNFTVEDGLLSCDRVMLCCDGLDTLAEVFVNEEAVAATDNMHRRYEFDIKQHLREGDNVVRIRFSSPTQFIRKKRAETPLWGAEDAMAGFPHIRKGHYMFGWDWGPKIPDMGIWRDIYLRGYRDGRIADVYVIQDHGEDVVDLDVRVDSQAWSGKELQLQLTVTSPSGEEIVTKLTAREDRVHIPATIRDPQLWWPNGYGDQPLYSLEVRLLAGGEVLDVHRFNIGLRTMRVRREEDQWGESFEFEVNGVSIFAMGADYIPEDNILARCNPERTERLIQDCVAANFNCIRVWGGGLYPEDYFFDLCDKYGLVVWQDFMFACAVYEMSDEFAANIRQEVEDNVKRIRHHACLGLWCGNNEMEWGWEVWGFPKTPKLRADYIKQFEVLIPEVVRETDPNTTYWPSSPSSGGSFDDPNDENRGDVHYWEVWHGLKPFTDYRNHYFRFVSEFGFQSFPALRTVREFTEPEDRNIFSYVMENHQKNGAGNGKILYYLSETFQYPKEFDSLLYVSQLLQAEAIKYGVEHWRRHRGRCMGAVYWQLNDCWPVASWASIDYYGRWKALHYFARRFFAPQLISAKEEGTSVDLVVSNETMTELSGSIVWKLRDNRSRVLREGMASVHADPLSVTAGPRLDFAQDLDTVEKRQQAYLEFALVVDGNEVSRGTTLFVKPKHFHFLAPQITASVADNGDEFLITLTAAAFAKYVELQVAEVDCRFSDNYFDLSAGEARTVAVAKSELPAAMTASELEKDLLIRSLQETY